MSSWIIFLWLNHVIESSLSISLSFITNLQTRHIVSRWKQQQRQQQQRRFIFSKSISNDNCGYVVSVTKFCNSVHQNTSQKEYACERFKGDLKWNFLLMPVNSTIEWCRLISKFLWYLISFLSYPLFCRIGWWRHFVCIKWRKYTRFTMHQRINRIKKIVLISMPF